MGSEGLIDPSKTAQLVSGNRLDLNRDLLHSVGKNLSYGSEKGLIGFTILPKGSPAPKCYKLLRKQNRLCPGGGKHTTGQQMEQR